VPSDRALDSGGAQHRAQPEGQSDSIGDITDAITPTIDAKTVSAPCDPPTTLSTLKLTAVSGLECCERQVEG
jgi:hypothetical protein